MLALPWYNTCCGLPHEHALHPILGSFMRISYTNV